MKGLLKNLGLLLILAGAITLIVSAFTGNVNNNVILGGSIAAIIIGLVSYIVINKRIAD
jgi:membrane-bound ClpP family serine protease